MTDRTMRLAQSLVALTVLAYALPERAEAQLAINSNATIYVTPEGQTLDKDDDKLENGSNVYISRAQCQGTWRFELQGYTQTVNFLELWAANSNTTNCADPANRNSTNLTDSTCWRIAYENAVNGKVNFVDIPGAKLFDRSGVCPEIRGTKFKVQFVTLDSNTQPGTTTAPAANNNPNQIAAVFTLYSAVPVRPENPKPRSGERTLGLSWSKINNDPLTEYRAYFDHAPDAPVALDDAGVGLDGGLRCGTGALTARKAGADGGTAEITGADLDVDNMRVFKSGTTKGNNLSIKDLDGKGIALNTETAVSVAAIDGAGNIGLLSTPICVKRVETISYLDSCRDAGTDCGELESCSLSPRNTGSAFWLSACTLAISAWARRRRRSI
jgi:hypothetical protein